MLMALNPSSTLAPSALSVPPSCFIGLCSANADAVIVLPLQRFVSFRMAMGKMQNCRMWNAVGKMRNENAERR